MRVLVTGSSGFIGTSLVPELRVRGHDVFELTRYYSGNRPQDDHHLLADVSDFAAVYKLLSKVRPDVVIHLAAITPVNYSFSNQEEVLRVNVGGTRAVADALVELGHGHLVFASSSEIYAKTTPFPASESEPAHGTSPYAVSKIASEELLRILHQTNDLPLTIMRPFNTYGRSLVNNRRYIVETAITQALTQKRIQLHDPRPERDFLFRKDHVDGYLKVVENLERANGETFNLTTGRYWSIGEVALIIARKVREHIGTPVEVEWLGHPDRPLDIERLQGDGTKARVFLGWEPQWDIEAGLSCAVTEWQQVLLHD